MDAATKLLNEPIYLDWILLSTLHDLLKLVLWLVLDYCMPCFSIVWRL